MGESGTITVRREDVESLLSAVGKVRSAFNPDATAIQEGAPGLAAFVDRLDSSAARLGALLERSDAASDRVEVDRENAELALAGLKRWRAAFNPDTGALKEAAPALASFAELLLQSAENIEAAL